MFSTIVFIISIVTIDLTMICDQFFRIMQARMVFYIKLFSLLHLCNAAPAEYDQIWDNLIR